MMEVLSIVVFGGAVTASVGVMAATIAPEWRRIVRLASGQVETSFQPLSHIAAAERRIAVRRWAASSPVRGLPAQRAAA